MNYCNPYLTSLQIKNIDAVDISATNVSCTTLSVDGEPISTALQNLGESTPGQTVYVGGLQADSFTTPGSLTALSVTSGTTSAGVLTASSLVATGSLSALSVGVTGAITAASLATTGAVTATGAVTGATLAGTLSTATQNSVTKIGTQTSLAVAGNITQSAGTASLLALTVPSVTCSGNISGTLTTASQPNITAVGSLATAGNITQSAGTTSLQATTVGSLATAGNITQSAGTTSLQATTVTSLATTGNITQSAGTTSLQALTVTGTINASLGSLCYWNAVTAVASTSNTWRLTFARPPLAIKIYAQDIVCLTWASGDIAELLFTSSNPATQTTDGITAGNNGGAWRYWDVGIVPLFNTVHSTQQQKICAAVDICNVGGSKYAVTGNAGRVDGTANAQGGGTFTNSTYYASDYFGEFNAGTGNRLSYVSFSFGGKAMVANAADFYCMYLS